MGELWIVQLFHTIHARKQMANRGMTLGDVEEAICLGKAKQARWQNHPEYGWRIVATGQNYYENKLTAILVPYEEHSREDAYKIVTAFWTDT